MRVPTALPQTHGILPLVVSLAALGSVLWQAEPAVAHPYHVTIAEAEWNPKAKSLEVALRVNSLDLDRMLRRATKSKLNVERPAAELERTVFAYLKRSLTIRQPDDKSVRPKWVGMELELNHAWLYFEFPMKRLPDSLSIENRLFLELESDQVNTISVRVDGKRSTLHFTGSKPIRTLVVREAGNGDSGRAKAAEAPEDASR